MSKIRTCSGGVKNIGIGYVQFTLSKEMESVRTEGAPGWHREESEASPDKFTQESCAAAKLKCFESADLKIELALDA